MNSFFENAEIMSVYSLQDALDDGVILCLSTKEGHEKDCRQFYKIPVYITQQLYGSHVEAANKLHPTDPEKAAEVVGWTIFDMLNMSVKIYKELSPQARLFEYKLQDTPHTFNPKPIQTIAFAGPGVDGEPIVTFMLPEEQ